MDKKPTLIAFCGKSASGKDFFAKKTVESLSKDFDVDFLVSHTTRPKRAGEIDGVNYYFIDEDTFLEELAYHNFMEYTNFRGWLYGHHKYNGNADYLIGIFDPKGIKTILKDCKDDFYAVIIIYLQARLKVRLKRSKEREGKWKIEYLRRAFADWKDFIGFEKYLTTAPGFGIIIDNNENASFFIMNQIKRVEYFVREHNLGKV